MESGNWFVDNHTIISLITGPIAIWLIWKIPRLHWSIKFALIFVLLFISIGILGMIKNLWLAPLLLIYLAMLKGVALKPIRYLLLTLGIILSIAATAFVIYVCYQDPSNILQLLFNKLSLIYFLPGVLCITFAHIIDEKIDAKIKDKEASHEN